MVSVVLPQRCPESAFPLGTLAVNGLGCFLFGFIWAVAEERALLYTETRSIVLIGFMGAFTTFSTYVFESGQMLRDSEWLLAGGNFFAQNVLGLFCLYLGMVLATCMNRRAVGNRLLRGSPLGNDRDKARDETIRTSRTTTDIHRRKRQVSGTASA